MERRPKDVEKRRGNRGGRRKKKVTERREVTRRRGGRCRPVERYTMPAWDWREREGDRRRDDRGREKGLCRIPSWRR